MPAAHIALRDADVPGGTYDDPRTAPPETLDEPSRTAPVDMTVEALVRAAATGDQRAWEELLSRFDGMIASVGHRYGLGPADVKDLQQTTWMRLIENLHRLEHPERVGGWLATTARRESLHVLSRSARCSPGADQMLDKLADLRSPDPDARPIAEEQARVLTAAWARLKPRCQQLLSLLMAEDAVGYKELSRLLSMPVGSIGPTRGRCVEHLRRLVVEEGMSGL